MDDFEKEDVNSEVQEEESCSADSLPEKNAPSKKPRKLSVSLMLGIICFVVISILLVFAPWLGATFERGYTPIRAI